MRLFSWRDLPGLGFVCLLIAAIYRPLVVEGRILASLDAEAYFYPNASFLVESLRAGRIPLWNPLIFAGVPFLANSQVGALYPPSWLYLLGPVSSVANALILGHIVLFAVGMYLLARVSFGLGRFGATYAAAVTAAGGLIGGMVGHPNQIEALAWTPFSVLLVERAVARSSRRLTAIASIPFALGVLDGHTQVVYLTGVLAVVVGVARAVQKPERGGSINWVGRQIGLILGGPILGALLSGVQIVPTLELTRLSIRSSGLGFADAAAGSLPPPYLLATILPTFGQAPPSTEWIGYVSVSAILLALFGLWRARRIETWWLVAIALVGLLLALGQYTPLYGIAYNVIPGFRLFRVPARWMILWVIGLSILAGWGADYATRSKRVFERGDSTARWFPLTAERFRNARMVWLVLLGGLLLSAALLGYRYCHVIIWPSVPTLALWFASAALFVVLLYFTSRAPAVRRGGLLALLTVELVAGASVLPSNDAIWPDAVESPRSTVLDVLSTGSTDRILALGDNTFDPGDLAAIRARLDGTLPPSARDAYVTALKHVEGMTPNTLMRYGLRTIDGYDGGILPLRGYHELKQLFANEGPDVTDGRLRIQLRSAPASALLGWLNVRWLLLDRLRDRTLGGTYYDLGIAQPLASGLPIRLQSRHPFTTSRLGVFLRGPGPTPPSGVLTIQIADQSVALQTDLQPGSSFSIEKAIDPNGLWFWTVSLPARVQSDAAVVTWQGEAGTTLRAMSAIDDAGGAGETITVSPSMRLRFLGDLKIYENTGVLSRAFLASGLTVQPTTASVLDYMRGGRWQAPSEAVSSAADVNPSLAFHAGGANDPASIVVDEPEQIVVDATATGQRVLVLTDSFYPGWRATVDGVGTPIIPVNLLFRGVLLSPGKHVVEFTYRPDSWYVGIGVSVVGLVVLALTLVTASRRTTDVDAA